MSSDENDLNRRPSDEEDGNRPHRPRSAAMRMWEMRWKRRLDKRYRHKLMKKRRLEKRTHGAWIGVGTGNTLILRERYDKVNWSTYNTAMRTLLEATFTKLTLATHCLTGRKSPSFPHNPAKKRFDPRVISDLTYEVQKRFTVTATWLRRIITSKCGNEARMLKIRQKKQKRYTRAGNANPAPPPPAEAAEAAEAADAADAVVAPPPADAAEAVAQEGNRRRRRVRQRE
ncbi:uncharacterized protein LOC118271866 [Spodoptera frugiperda]|uniref:Uncharacterized protein LOC118271866 n=1 Tax=Spodoptera frugiperda TaxID=7108 RepID=A0A9R0EM15_SPOFR|nr:uncharacterized protein LOC118271866 [Spodoptera frugiperda]